MNTITDVSAVGELDHDMAMALQASELDRTVAMLRSLDAADWDAQTDCPDWNVLQMYQHVLGACDAAASLRENVRQMRAGKSYQKANGGPLEAGLSAVQIADRSDLGPTELVHRLATVAPITVRKRTTFPAPLRRLKMGVDGPVVEKWALGYLMDTIYLRDLWMHRVDATRATGRDLELTPDHDGEIVADVVAEWARRHGRPFTLTLTGPAGGAFTSDGVDGVTDGSADALELDAVEFCRTLAGRASGAGLLTTIVPF